MHGFRRYRGRLLRGAVIALWLGLMARLVFGEAFPGLFRVRAAGYRAWFGSVPTLSDHWMRILVQGRPIGYSHTRVDLRTENGRDELWLQNRMRLSLPILGRPHPVAAGADVRLDADQRLQRFSFQLDSDPYRFRVEGRRQRGRRFEVEMETAAFRRIFSVEIPDDAILYSPMADAPLAQLAPGREVRMRLYDPISLSSSEAIVRAIGRETIEVEGASQEALAVQIEYRGMESQAWIASDGRLLRQTTPFGWTLEAASARAALDAARAAPFGGDILSAVAVPVLSGPVPDWHARALVIRLSGAPALARAGSVFPRQTVVQRESDAVTLRLVAAPERPARETPLSDADRAHGLEKTPFIPWDHPEIERQAHAIAPDVHEPLALAEAICEWVHAHLRKSPAVSLPSALDILRNREGDCNEHTYLFVALARARGLPARIFVGLVPNEDAFYYHAWPAVYVGEWIEMDPTLGLRRVGAGHIALAEGELEGQMALAGLLGRLRAEVSNGTGD